MISAKEAVAVASGFLSDLVIETPELRLEQVSPIGSDWQVVLSYKSPGPDYQAIFAGDKRLFKAVTVNRESGEPQSMTMWKV